MKKLFPVALSISLLSGCGTIDRGHVQREWSNTFRELGIVPLFPPREDVYVGDVYAYSFDPNGEDAEAAMKDAWYDPLSTDQKKIQRLIGMNSRLTHIDLEEDALTEYKKRPSFPQTSSDYNDIAGNPALAAAEENVLKESALVTSLEAPITAAKVALKESEDKLLAATRSNDDAAKTVAAAEAKLTEGKARTVDTSKEKALLTTAKAEQRDAFDAVSAAQYKVDTSSNSPQPVKDAAALELQTAKRALSLADLKVTRANEDLTARSAEKVDTTDLESDLATKKKDKDDKAAALIAATRKKEDDATALTQVTATQTPRIAAEQVKLEKAKAIQQAIAEAGAKMLYNQPHDETADVFNGKAIPDQEKLLKPRINRLRLVAFPEFSTVSVTSGGLSALVPVEALNLGVNISASDVKTVSVKIPAAESYSVSLDSALSKIFIDNKNTQLNPTIENTFAWASPQYPGAKSPRYVYLRVITEVYYARAMDVGIFATTTFGARGSVQTPIAPATSGEGLKVNSNPSSTSQMDDILHNISQSQSVPGGSVQIVSQNASSIGIRRVFDRPIAIGFRGLIITFDADSRKVVGSLAVDGSSTPTFMRNNLQ